MFRGIAILLCLGALAAGEQAPRPAPELKVTLADGGDFVLAKQRGKVVALALIYTTCPHCQNASQVMDKLYREYKPQGLEAVAVACNDGADLLVGEFVKEFDIAFPVGIGYPMLLFEALGSQPHPIRLPALLLIDRKGMVRATHTGEEQFFADLEGNLRQAIEPLLKEPGPAAAKPAARQR